MIDKEDLEVLDFSINTEVGFLMKMAHYLIIRKEECIREKF